MVLGEYTNGSMGGEVVGRTDDMDTQSEPPSPSYYDCSAVPTPNPREPVQETNEEEEEMWEVTFWDGIRMRVTDMEIDMDCLNRRTTHLEKHLPGRGEKAFEAKNPPGTRSKNRR